jgi:2-oxoglutarate dehydrogenase E2 component (dihydrolipoamide succinyltransferase)
MAVSVTMPRLGESVSEGTVTRWLKQEGDQVEADEPLLEVSTDKVDTEIPSPASGTLSSIKVQEDETVEVGVELATIDDGSGGGRARRLPAAEQATPTPSRSRSPSPSRSPSRSPAGPRPRRRPSRAEPSPSPSRAAQQPQPAPQQAPAPSGG